MFVSLRKRIRYLFYDKAQSARVKSLYQQVKPKMLSTLTAYRDDIEKLAADGLGVPQLVKYLKQHKVNVLADTVRKFLTSAAS